MISFIKGELAELLDNKIIIECHGMGYEISVPQNIFSKLPSVGQQIKIHTYLQVREDAIGLYGFLEKSDLEVFKLLITVNGIGPKGALGILSSITAEELQFAVLAEDVKTISKVPGIGQKTAGKLVLELKDKFKLEDAFKRSLEQSSASGKMELEAVQNEAIQALCALGYSGQEAMRAVRLVEAVPGMNAEQLLKQSLKNIGR